MVLCAFPMIKAGQTVRVQLATVVTAAPALNRSLVTMGAYKAASIPIMFVESADGGFVRPAAGVTPLLVVSPVSPVSVAKPAAANAPLFAGLTLTTLFGLTIIGWLRRSLNEDPVLAIAGAT